MAKRNRESESDGATAMTTTPYNTVFIDTSLGTHLAMIVSDVDTVADFKKKIQSEHPQCFPKIGEIKIHALKVKRKGCVYHLSDSMLVKSAFEGAKKNWFLSVDASSPKGHGENLHSWKPDAGDQLALLCITNYPSSDGNYVLPGSLNKLSNEDALLPEAAGPGNSSGNADREILNDMMVGNTSQPGPTARKKRKRESKEGTGSPLEKDKTLVFNSDRETSKSETIICEKSIEERQKGRNATSDSLFTELPDDVLLLNSSSNEKRRKKGKKKSSLHHDQLFSSRHVGEENFKEDEEIKPKDAGRVSYVAAVPDESIQHAIITKHLGISQKEKHTEPVQGIVEGNKVTCSSISEKREKHTEPVSALHNDEEENFKEDEEIKSKDSGNVSYAEAVPEESIQHATLAKHLGISQKGKHTEPVQEVVEGNEVPCSSISKKMKNKRKKKSSRSSDQLFSALHDVGEESFKEDKEIKPKDSGGVSYASAVPEDSIQHAILSKHLRISEKEKHSEPVQEVVEGNNIPCSSIGINMIEPDTGTVKGKEDAPEPAAGFGSKRRKNSKKHHTNDVKGVPSLPARELDNLKRDDAQSGHENVVPSYHNFGTIQTEKIEEEKELSQNDDSEAILPENCKPLNPVEFDMNVGKTINSAKMSDANVFMESGSPAANRRKKKRVKKSDDSEATLSENCKALNLDEFDMNVGKTINSVKMSDANVVMESGSSAANRRKKRRAKKSDAGEQFSLDPECAYNSTSGISSTAPFSTLNGCSSSEAKKEERNLTQAEKAKVSESNDIDPSFMVADREVDNVAGNEAISLMATQIRKGEENAENIDEKSKKKKKRSSTATTLPDLPMKEQGNEVASVQLSKSNKIPENVENVDEKLRKITKKNKKFSAKTFLDLPIKEQEVGGEELASPNDRMRKVDTASKTTKKTQSGKTGALNQLTGSELELEKNINTECGSFHPQRNSLTIPPSQVLSSQSVESNSKGTVPHANVVSDALMNGCMDDAYSHMEGSNCEGDKINFRDYFVVAGYQKEVAPAEVLVHKVNEAKRSEGKLKKNVKKPVPAGGTTPDRKSHSRNSCSIQLQESLPKGECNEAMLKYNKKSSKVSQNGGKALHAQDIDQIKSISQEARRPDIFNVSGTSSPSPAYPKKKSDSSASFSSSSKSSDEGVQQRMDNGHQSTLPNKVTVPEVSSKNNGVAVTTSKHEKSLLATPGAIFRDDSSESSDENEAKNSDASTRTPSDNSSLSGHSEEKSKSSLESPINGSYGAKGKEVGGKNIKESVSSGPKNIPIDMVFRSSSRFKKAKLSASQPLLEDTESQPVDFVPDSQADL